MIDVLLTALADGDILTYDAATGQWINVAPPQPATKEIFVPATIGLAGATPSNVGDHGGYLVDASSENTRIEVHVPHDFTVIDEAVVVFIPLETLTPMEFTVYTDVAANGEAYNTHSRTWSTTMNTVANKIQELDISSPLVDINAGDYIGVQFLCDFGTSTNALVLGVRLKYT